MIKSNKLEQKADLELMHEKPMHERLLNSFIIVSYTILGYQIVQSSIGIANHLADYFSK